MIDKGTIESDFAEDAEADIADWKRAHGELVRLAALRASMDWDEGCWLLSALRFGAHLKLGFGSFFEYVVRLFGYRPRFTQEKLRVAEALEELPELERALKDGELNWSAVRELSRVATLTTEQSWIDAARGRSVRDVEKLVSGRKPGDRPSDPASPEAKRHTLRFDVSAEVLATFRDAMAKLRRETGGKLDDDEALLLMARQVLGGPADSGRSSYQLSVTLCDRCRQATSKAAVNASRSAPKSSRWRSATRKSSVRPTGGFARPLRPRGSLRPSLPRCAGRCSNGMAESAASRAAAMASTSICTTSNHAPRAGITTRRCWSRSAACTTARPTWVHSS